MDLLIYPESDFTGMNLIPAWAGEATELGNRKDWRGSGAH